MCYIYLFNLFLFESSRSVYYRAEHPEFLVLPIFNNIILSFIVLLCN